MGMLRKGRGRKRGSIPETNLQEVDALETAFPVTLLAV